MNKEKGRKRGKNQKKKKNQSAHEPNSSHLTQNLKKRDREEERVPIQWKRSNSKTELPQIHSFKTDASPSIEIVYLNQGFLSPLFSSLSSSFRQLSCEEVLESEESDFDEEMIGSQNSFSLESVDTELDSPQSIDILPDDILLLIFQYAHCQLSIRSVCKRWRDVIEALPKNLLVCDGCVSFGLMLQNERKKHHFSDYLINQQTEITDNMRRILIDWLMEVCQEYHMDIQTLFLSIHYLDTYLSVSERKVPRNQLQLFGIVSLLIASKFHETEIVPSLEDLVYLSDDAYTTDQIIEAEQNMLNTICFDLRVHTRNGFLLHFLRIVRVMFDDNQYSLVKNRCQYLLELGLLQYSFIFYKPSLVAASVLSFSMFSVGFPAWNYTLEHASRYTFQDLIDCIKKLYDLILLAPKWEQVTVQKKYQKEEYGILPTDFPNPSILFEQTSIAP